MKMIAIDGSIIDCFGPYPATINDADIIKQIDHTAFENILQAGDVILVDRGFRDSVRFLKKKHFIVKMTEFVQKGTHGQLTTAQGNKSRLVTKMRFAIEVANGRMKNKWSIFNKIIPSILTPNLMADYKIGAALMNAFAQPIICDKFDHVNISSRMLNSVTAKNHLTRIINSKSFQRTKKFFFGSIEPNELTFPKYTREQLKSFACGTYCIKQAVSYAAEHIKVHGVFQISVLPNTYVSMHFGKICSKEKINEPIFIAAKIKSRFRGAKMHNTYILYDACDINKKIYFCKCQHGKRTVGCCSHTMTVVWYFGFGRHQGMKDPASHLNDFFV